MVIKMKLIKTMVSLIMMVLMLVPIVAASEPQIYPYYPNQEQTTNRQFYTVIFDDEGEAAVAGKITIYNTNTAALDKLKIEIPGYNIRLINAFQEAKSLVQKCVEYKDLCTAGDERVCTKYYPDGTCKIYETVHNPCLRKEQQCLRQEPSYDWPLQYHSVEYTKETLSRSTTFTFNLPHPINQFETATILLYYKAPDYAEKSLGVWQADFETPKIGYDVTDVRVALNVIPNLYLKGGEANIGYLPSFFAAAEQKLAAPAASAELSSFSSQIEYSQGYIKQAQALDPWESFHVEAEYSSSWAMLYLSRIIEVAGAILILLFGVIRAKRKLNKMKTSAIPPFIKSIFVSFVSAVMINAVLFGSSWLLSNSYRWFGYNNTPLLGLITILFTGTIVLILLFGPALYIGFTQNPMISILTFMLTIIWLFIIGVITLFFLSAFPSPPVYQMYGVLKAI